MAIPFIITDIQLAYLYVQMKTLHPPVHEQQTSTKPESKTVS